MLFMDKRIYFQQVGVWVLEQPVQALIFMSIMHRCIKNYQMILKDFYTIATFKQFGLL